MSRYVLVVDDDPDARLVLKLMLKSVGLQIKEAEDGADAMKMVEESMPSLILLDLMMPGMDGFRVLARLSERPETRHIPVVVVSACAAEQKVMLQLPRVKKVLRKGEFSTLEIIQLVREILGLQIAASSVP